MQKNIRARWSEKQDWNAFQWHRFRLLTNIIELFLKMRKELPQKLYLKLYLRMSRKAPSRSEIVPEIVFEILHEILHVISTCPCNCPRNFPRNCLCDCTLLSSKLFPNLSMKLSLFKGCGPIVAHTTHTLSILQKWQCSFSIAIYSCWNQTLIIHFFWIPCCCAKSQHSCVPNSICQIYSGLQM